MLVADHELLVNFKPLMWRAAGALLTQYETAAGTGTPPPAVLSSEAASAIMMQGLAELTPELPVVDRSVIDSWIPQSHANYWLVDSWDGEREFTNREGDFACTLALIEHGQPTFGFVVVPLQEELYCGGPTARASREGRMGKPVMIRHARFTSKPVRVVASPAGVSDTAKSIIESLNSEHEIQTTSQCMKLLKIATGEADIYPCTHLSLKWHTAAAQAILEGAGGSVLTEAGAPLSYADDDVSVGRYVASAV